MINQMNDNINLFPRLIRPIRFKGTIRLTKGHNQGDRSNFYVVKLKSKLQRLFLSKTVYAVLFQSINRIAMNEAVRSFRRNVSNYDA